MLVEDDGRRSSELHGMRKRPVVLLGILSRGWPKVDCSPVKRRWNGASLPSNSSLDGGRRGFSLSGEPLFLLAPQFIRYGP